MSERRSARRVDVQLNAEFILEGKRYTGFINNVSESGLGYLITSSLSNPEIFTPLKIAEIRFQAPSGQFHTVSGKTVWYSKTLPRGNTLILGIKLIDPPQAYKEWIRDLL